MGNYALQIDIATVSRVPHLQQDELAGHGRGECDCCLAGGLAVFLHTEACLGRQEIDVWSAATVVTGGVDVGTQ